MKKLPGRVVGLDIHPDSFAGGILQGKTRHALVMESKMAGKIGKTYCANDRVDAIKIARIHLSGLASLVWQPDERTREQRELFSAYQCVVREPGLTMRSPLD